MSNEISSVLATAQIRPVAEATKVEKPSLESQSLNSLGERLDQAVEARRAKFVEKIAKAENLEQGKLIIEKDDESGRFVHKLLDPQTGKIVRQWPDDKWLEFAKQHGAEAALLVNLTA